MSSRPERIGVPDARFCVVERKSVVEGPASPTPHMPGAFALPRLYPILDAALLTAANIEIEMFARTLYAAGIRFLQYRDKDSVDEVIIERAGILRGIFPKAECTLILNDRVHLCAATDFDGVHIGQDDLPPKEAREQVGPGKILGLSTHNPRQVAAADRELVDYIAIGPIFGTKSKANPDPVVGRDGLAQARATTTKPLVAIGGITVENCRMLLRAGADSLAVISALVPSSGQQPGKRTEDFLVRIR